MVDENLNYDRFEDKAEAVCAIAEEVGTHDIVLTTSAIKYAVPWGDQAIEDIERCSVPIEQQHCVPRAPPETLTIGSYELLQVLVDHEGREPIKVSMAGAGFTSERNYRLNLPLLMYEVDGVSPDEELDYEWRELIRNRDRALDVESTE